MKFASQQHGYRFSHTVLHLGQVCFLAPIHYSLAGVCGAKTESSLLSCVFVSPCLDRQTVVILVPLSYKLFHSLPLLSEKMSGYDVILPSAQGKIIDKIIQL